MHYYFTLFSLIIIIVAGNEYGNRIKLLRDRIPHWKNTSSWNFNDYGPFFGQPEQIHLSYAGNVSAIYVTWLTFDDVLDSKVQYGIEYGNLNLIANACIDYFEDGGKDKRLRYTHRALIYDIKPGIRYFYRVGSQYGWSSIFSFVGLHERPDGGFRYAVYGDMGNVNARSLGKLQRLAQSGDYDMVLHVGKSSSSFFFAVNGEKIFLGDFAYDLDTDQGNYGDEFMRQIEPIAAYVPYMTVVGNHENAYNFSHYINRYTMPGTSHNLFYSFDLGVAHFIVFSTEFYFFMEYGTEQLKTQWNFLVQDLEKANLNRENVPWIITMGHRPMYCSDLDTDDCTKINSIIRTGLPGIHAYALEKLFFTYGVDLELWAHEHTFERMYAVYNRTMHKSKNPYVDPLAPVHIVSGSAGCQESTDRFIKNPDPWSAFRSSHYSFSRMQIFNKTHLYFEQVLAEEAMGNDSAVIDNFWLIKNKHGPYSLHKLKKYGIYVPEKSIINPVTLEDIAAYFFNYS